MRKSSLFPIFLVVFIDLLGFSLILPLLPFYADVYGATPFVVGLLTASYAAAQLIGAPLLGRLSDRFGRRPVLLLSIGGTLLGFLLLGVADPLGRWIAGLLTSTEPTLVLQNVIILGVLFFSRILDGLTGGNISVAQAYITDVTQEKDRARGLGMIGAAFGLGFILGPAAGGILSSWGYAVPAFAAAGLAAINLLSVGLFLPESLTPDVRERLANQPRQAFSLRSLWAAISRPRVGPLLHIRFFFGLAFATFQTIFPLFAQYRLELDARQTGFVLAYVGVLAAFVQGFGISLLTKRFSENYLILVSAGLMGITLAVWSVTPNVLWLLLVLIPLASAGGVLNTVLNSALTKVVYAEEVGGTLGLSASVESLTRVIAPTTGGWMFGMFGAWAPGIFGALLMGWVVTFAWRRLFIQPDPPLKPRDNEVVSSHPA